MRPTAVSIEKISPTLSLELVMRYSGNTPVDTMRDSSPNDFSTNDDQINLTQCQQTLYLLNKALHFRLNTDFTLSVSTGEDGFFALKKDAVFRCCQADPDN
jgi:hypothetical protein